MRRLAPVLKAPRAGLAAGLLCALLAPAGSPGCAGGGGGRSPAEEAERPVPRQAGPAPRQLDFLYVFENTRDAPYYPVEGIGGVAYARDGTLIFCDEKGGRVHARDPGNGEWYLFGSGPASPYRPVDVRIDGFAILVLDLGGRLLLRFDINGVLQDRLLNFRRLDAAPDRTPTAFDVDVDGRLVCVDAGESQVLLFDPFLNLIAAFGDPGSHRQQLRDPSGVVFLPDGGFVVADRGNRRLQRYNRLGYYEAVIGGEFDPRNPLLTPQGLDTDRHGNLFVADPAAGAVHIFDGRLQLRLSLGSEMGLLASPLAPMDVAVGPDDLLAVADRERQAILVYRIVYEE